MLVVPFIWKLQLPASSRFYPLNLEFRVRITQISPCLKGTTTEALQPSTWTCPQNLPEPLQGIQTYIQQSSPAPIKVEVPLSRIAATRWTSMATAPFSPVTYVTSFGPSTLPWRQPACSLILWHCVFSFPPSPPLGVSRGDVCIPNT